MKHEEFSKYRSSDCVKGRDEDRLFGESVYDDENSVIAGGWWELFDEVHGDGVPQTFGDR